jgi:hypothetical protein
MEHLVDLELAGDTELLGENLPQCHFIIIIIIGKTAPF